eukprot:3500334-Pleurochrysis_carterae.AAC.1
MQSRLYSAAAECSEYRPTRAPLNSLLVDTAHKVLLHSIDWPMQPRPEPGHECLALRDINSACERETPREEASASATAWTHGSRSGLASRPS